MAHGHNGETKYKPGEVAWGAEHHILPISAYAKTIAALFVLMALTIYAASLDLGSLWNNVIALSIACIKATLVVMFFMHVKFSTKLTRLYAIGGFVWFVLLFYILVDYWSRPLDPSIANTWMHDPGSALGKKPGDPASHPADPFAENVRPRH